MGTETRTITMTDRPPVRIRPDDWPIVAAADGDSFTGSDPARHQQALQRGEVDKYVLKVRRHANGRTIVYGTLRSAHPGWNQPAGGIDWRGGELLADGENEPAAIRRVGEDAGIPEHLIRECIADLPAEVL